ncbi:hypothetical protein [Flavobacterium caeni]|uniref:Uncharacterized protein n=1 Tax=Flavobacterium caeni TaxID=490189 RepID=A0A1G5KLD3_9FLAO|nr:hypothetical protein [Flavobacterium caeni]SCZ01463.1 hypothetical protein SAMN02927903_03370 [Flavobacterium caeni]
MNITQKQLLKIFLVIAIINVILIEFVLSDIPEKIYFGNKIGIIVSRISLGYISSYIFYLMVVVMKQKKDKKNIYGAVYNLTDRIIYNGYAVFNFVLESAGENPKEYDKAKITKDEYLKICEKADLSQFPENKMLGVPPNLIKANFANFIYVNCVKNVEYYSEKVFTYMPFLDSTFVNLINNLHHNIFFIRRAHSLTIILNGVGINPHISKSMWEYFDLVRKIDDYSQKNLKQYFTKIEE